jgi:hypothetical protein
MAMDRVGGPMDSVERLAVAGDPVGRTAPRHSLARAAVGQVRISPR